MKGVSVAPRPARLLSRASGPMLPALRAVKALARSRRFRHATTRARLLPSFLVIGAHPAGAMSLFNALCRHPDVAGPTAAREDVDWSKDLHFFDDKFWRGLDWYRSFFPLSVRRRIARRRGRDLIAGEATPSYIFHPAAPARVAATLPDVRLIALLRDPIDRAFAHYLTMNRMGLDNLSFEDALAAEEERLAGEEERVLADPRYSSNRYRHYAYVTRGLYADQLERWLAHFPREQLLVLRAEDFLAEPADVFAQALAFLGLRPWRPRSFVTAYGTTPTRIDPAVRARLEERFAEPNARLARLLGGDFGWGQTTSAAEPALPGQSGTSVKQ